MADATSSVSSITINRGTFDLSMINPEEMVIDSTTYAKSGPRLTANVYTIDGVYWEGTTNLRQLSIGELVMAICLRRASELETQIIEKMKSMEEVSEQLEKMSSIESDVVENFQNDTSGHAYDLNANLTFLRELGILNDNQRYVRNDAIMSNADIMYDDFITKIEAKMDEKNSFSQQTMIELQSYTNKRDQSYDMVSNILKSLNTVQTGIVNNM